MHKDKFTAFYSQWFIKVCFVVVDFEDTELHIIATEIKTAAALG